MVSWVSAWAGEVECFPNYILKKGVFILKNYVKPTLEIAKITTNEAMAAGSPKFNKVTDTTENGMPVSIYNIASFSSNS